MMIDNAEGKEPRRRKRKSHTDPLKQMTLFKMMTEVIRQANNENPIASDVFDVVGEYRPKLQLHTGDMRR